MGTNASVEFFDRQFQRQVATHEHALNPFEKTALPHLRGKVLDYGCGLGHLALEAARRGCAVTALDGSAAAIEYLRGVARREGLPLEAMQADLRTYELAGSFDAVACIGLLMFFDCTTADRQLEALQAHTRPGGVLVVNVLTEGTTYLEMFSPEGHCLLAPDELRRRFAGWAIESDEMAEFPAPGDTRKVFVTLAARKPHEARAGG